MIINICMKNLKKKILKKLIKSNNINKILKKKI